MSYPNVLFVAELDSIETRRNNLIKILFSAHPFHCTYVMYVVCFDYYCFYVLFHLHFICYSALGPQVCY